MKQTEKDNQENDRDVGRMLTGRCWREEDKPEDDRERRGRILMMS